MDALVSMMVPANSSGAHDLWREDVAVVQGDGLQPSSMGLARFVAVAVSVSGRCA